VKPPTNRTSAPDPPTHNSQAPKILNLPQAVSPDGSEFANAAIASDGVKLEIDSTTSNATSRVLSFTPDPTSRTPSMTAVVAWQ
jgi:hypothetical protein